MNILSKCKIYILKIFIFHPFKKNVFKTNYQKKVLISYMTRPFCVENNYTHTNYLECKTAAEIFNELGYQVDVIDFGYKRKKIDYSQYAVIYGMGWNLEHFFSGNDVVTTIYYATGCNPIYSNLVTLQKARKHHEKTGFFALNSTRVIDISQDRQFLLSNHVIVLGNEFTKRTYTQFDPAVNRYSNLNCFFYKTLNISITEKNIPNARKNFLWFGSYGCLHKGLDIAIETFLQRPDLQLYICGPTENEDEFWSYYMPIINKAPNIHHLGFINVHSNRFKELLLNCFFTIYPSESEGGAAALLTVLGNGGLIPLISESVGLDLPASIKFTSGNTPLENLKLIDFYAQKSDTELLQIAEELQDYVCKNYSYELYETNLKRIIKNIVEK